MRKSIFSTVFILLFSSLLFSSTGKIVGVVTEANSGIPLPGANVAIKGTALGTATNLEGEYTISRVPPGSYTLIVSYIGYEKAEVSVRVVAEEVTRHNFELKSAVVEGEEVVVTALLQGQAGAINKQLSSNTIVNVVSKDKIEDLPDQNAAESLGRLPGIAIQREAGEGTKVSVRGLSPRFNSITINGERIPATGTFESSASGRVTDDRSVDLSMISSDLLEGIEVFKALTPDKDADAVGGTINFVLRKARPGFKGNARFQYGYNDHETDFGQYKGTFSASNRFLKNQLGVVATGSIQSANRSSDLLDASYTFKREMREGEERALIGVANLNLGDRLETRERLGASLTFDYEIGENGSLLLSSFWGRTERDELRRRKRYRVEAARTEYDLRDREINTVLFTNSLSGEYDFGALKMDWRGSFSRTRQELPFSHFARFRELAAFRGDLVEDQGPEFIPLGAKNNLDETFFKESAFDSTSVTDRDLTAQIDFKVPYSLGDDIVGHFKFGGKVRDKDRDRDNQRFWTSFFGINDLAEELPDGMFELTDERKIAMSNFLNPNASVDDFLDGQYEFGPVLDLQAVNNFGRQFRNYQFSGGGNLFVRDPLVDLDDYEAGEQVLATYLLTELNLGRHLMLLPGFRIEKTRTDYRSIFGDPSTNEDGQIVGALTDTTGGQDYTEFLPMAHLRVKPASWFDLRFAVTRSISRPDYFNLVPWQRILEAEFTIDQGNPTLEHTKVWNYDAYLSFYSRMGLFTVGAFYKEVEDIDYLRTTRLTEGEFRGFQLTEPINAEGLSKVRGIELDLQTNLSLLPSPFDGIVIGAILSFIDSETFFPLFEIGPRSPDPPFAPTVIDTVREGRMPGQADRIANLVLGYEKGGFTGRVSMTYQGEILETIGTRSELDGFSDAFVRWDLALQQEIYGRFSLFLNANNVTNRAEAEFLGIRAFPTRDEFFGWTADLGMRYKF